MAARGPQNGRRGLESLGFFGFPSTFTKFFDPSTPSMRKGREKKGKKKIKIFSMATNAVES